MFSIRSLFDLYIKASFHVALMVVCFYEMTQFQWAITTSLESSLFVFSLAFLGYNGIKYYPFSALSSRSSLSLRVFVILIGIAGMVYALSVINKLSLNGRLLLLLCFGLCIAYTVPFTASSVNLRNRFGVKIFIVALCWTLITAALPLIDLPLWSHNHYVFFMERFIFIFIATLPFEIRDSKQDQIHLGTIPQLVGIDKTRWLGAVLTLFIFGLKYAVLGHWNRDMVALCLMGIAYLVALFNVHPKHSENITLFWVEIIPLLGWLSYRSLSL